MDAGYKTPWIAKKTLEKHDIPILPYTRHKGKEGRFRPWEYEYDPANDCYICPLGGMLRHTTTDRDGKRTYRSIPKECVTCHIKAKCGANEKGQKLYTSHIWQEHLDLVEALRKTERGKELYAKRKETIERVFADAKEKHAMRYTHHRGLARVTNWVRLKYAAMNLKKIANWSWNNSFFSYFSAIVAPFQTFRIQGSQPQHPGGQEQYERHESEQDCGDPLTPLHRHRFHVSFSAAGAATK